MEKRNKRYSVGGTILSGMIGAYVGYKYAESKKKGRKLFANGGGVGMYDAHKANIKYLESISEMEKMKILKNISNHYGISVNEAEDEVTYDEAEYLYEYIANDPALRMKVYQEMKVNKMARGGKFNQSWSQDHYRHNKGESYEVPVAKRKHKYEGGGGIGFKGLSSKVAKRYEGKKVAPKYQGEYGKRYSKSEAGEVGDKVAGKVYRQQQGRKFAGGGGVDNIKISGIYRVNGKDYLFHSPRQDYRGDYSQWETYEVAYDEIEGEKHIDYKRTKKANRLKFFPISIKAEYVGGDYFAKGGMTEHGLKVGDEIMGYTKDVNELHVVNRKNNDEWHSVDLDDGKRYAGGGGIKHSYEIEQEGDEFIVEFYKSDGKLDWGRGGFSSREEAEKYALENRRYAQGGGVSGLNDLIRG